MAVQMRRKGAAAAALVVAGGTLIASVAAAGPAGAAAAGAPAFYSGATQGNVVQVTLNLPQALPGIPNPAGLGLISASGTALHNVLSGPVTNSAQSFAGLASGSLVHGAGAPLSVLDMNATATTTSKPDSTNTLGTIPTNPLINGSVGSLAAHVLSTLPSSLATANLASLNVGSLQAILPSAAVQAIQSAYNQVTQQTQPAVNQAVSTINQVLAPVIQNDPTGVAASLDSAVNQLAGQLDCSKNSSCLLNNILGSSLLSLDGLDARQNVTQIAGGVDSEAHAALLKLNILGGLLTVNGFTSDATAFADGRAGQGKAAGNAVLASALVDHGLLGVTLGNGATGTILGIEVGGLSPQLVDQINSALNQLVSTLNSILAQVGVSVTATQGTSHVSPDGKTATATGAILTIAVTPPVSVPGAGSASTDSATHAAAPAVLIQLGGTTAQARAEQAPPQVARPAASTPAQALPHTGANLPLTAGIGLGLFGIAALLRRRLAER